MKIPLVDLKSEYLSIKSDIDSAIAEVIEKTSFINGPFLKRFEQNYAEWCGAKHCIGTSNGTSSLFVALRAMGLKPGHEVIAPANTFIATTEAVTLAGGKVKLCDVEENSRNMVADTIKSVLTSKTKAIIPVHLYGHPVDMDPIYELAEDKDLIVLEDAAQAHGAEYKGKRIGARGVASFSFFPAKILGCYGDGGAVTTNDNELAENIRMEVDHGRKTKYEHERETFNFRLDALQANILNAKLPHLSDWIDKRRKIANLYTELLKIDTPTQANYAKHAFYMYVARNKNRDKIIEKLKEQNIFCGIHYPIPLHMQPAYKYLGYTKGAFPIAEKLCDDIISLPLYPAMTEEQTRVVSDAINDVI